jgi:hypothetical protein
VVAGQPGLIAKTIADPVHGTFGAAPDLQTVAPVPLPDERGAGRSRCRQ